MKTTRPKQKFQFPNAWAMNSFLLCLKRKTDWEYVASSDDIHIKARPKGARDYMLIEVMKSGRETGIMDVEINAEKLGDGGEKAWTQIADFARMYRI
jgi:hypothetical protein